MYWPPAPSPERNAASRSSPCSSIRMARWNVTNTFEIYATWRHRFAPGVTHNVEHVFGLALPARVAVVLSPAEHIAFAWLPWREAAEKCFSWSNRDAIMMLGEKS